MAKGLGLIGNFRGKFGNAVGYNLKDSNNKQTQGIRIYQPIVKNPKTYAQAEQRAKLAPINATYRLLKPIIDRGQEGVAYGNKSRLAWLRVAMTAFTGPWYKKGEQVTFPVFTSLSKGSLNTGLTYVLNGFNGLKIAAPVETVGTLNVGSLSTQLINAFPALREGDQLTFVNVVQTLTDWDAHVDSVILSKTSTDALPSLVRLTTAGVEYGEQNANAHSSCLIVSREGSSGQHLRSNAPWVHVYTGDEVPMNAQAKESAIRSYMAAGTSTDWPEEPIED